MMYRIYLLCFTSAVVFGNSDEAKYIDLLPETEKQEFLNRIARRIMEEIQSKHSPEQSHAEVSDDQLNAHHAYVQDLIKEESESLKNERRDYNIKENVEREGDNEELEKENITEEVNNAEMDENSQHIDLTLRADRDGEKNERKLSDDSKFSVIPVKVVYDQDDFNNNISSTNNSILSHLNTENSHSNNSRIELLHEPPFLGNFTEEKENDNPTNRNSTHHSQESENQSENVSNNPVQILTVDSQNLVLNSTDILFSTDPTIVTGDNKEVDKFDDSFENTTSSTKIIITTNKNIEGEHNYSTDSNLQSSNNNAMLLSLTTNNSTQYKSNISEHDNSSLSGKQIYMTTIKNKKENSSIKSKPEDIGNMAHSAAQISDMKTKKDLKRNVARKHLRKRLEILSEEYEIEKEASKENKNKMGRYKNNNIKEYFVYEVPEEKPTFVRADDPNENEQRYVVPIYNFAPKNAYYTSYNHFGMNNDEDDEVINKKSLFNNEQALDKELYLRSGFQIDLNLKHHNYRNDKKGQYKYAAKYPQDSHWLYTLNSKFGNGPTFIDYQDNEALRRKLKRDNNIKEISQHLDKRNKLPKLPKIPSKIKYIPLRQGTEIDYDNETQDELYLQSGLITTLHSKSHAYQNDKRGKDILPMIYPQHILNSKHEYYPDLLDYQGNETFKQKIKHDINLKQISRHERQQDRLLKPPKIPPKIKYIPLRKWTESEYRQSMHKKALDGQNLSKSRTKNHIDVIKTGLHEQKNVHNGDLEFNNDNSKYNDDRDTKNNQLEYYFGKYNANNNTDEFDANDDIRYPALEDATDERQNYYDYTNKRHVKIGYRMEADDNCEHGCIEMAMKTPKDNFDNYLDNLLGVLKDMIYRDKIELVNYDWLLSTVDLENALKKLTELTKAIEKGNTIHGLDLKLLKYVVYLYNKSRYAMENTIQSNKQSKALQDINYIVNSFLKLLRRRIAMPKNKKKKPGDRITNPIEFWYKHYVRGGLVSDDTRRLNLKMLKRFETLLNDLEDNLFELHDAVKYIAIITTYRKQNWYRDLKNVYLKSASRKQLLQVILHLATSRLFNSIEDTARYAEEDELFINNNEGLVRRIQKEFIFVLRILDRIKEITH